MQLLVLAMILGILAHDARWDQAAAPGDAGVVVALVLLPKFAIALLYAAACWWTLRRLHTAAGLQSLRWLDRLGAVFRWVTLVMFSLDLYQGALLHLRQTLGDLVLVDELLVMLPTLGMFVWAWWCYYPIDRRLREATLMKRIDSGKPVYPIWTRRQFLVSQFRHQVALVLAPLLIILAWMETVALLGGGRREWWLNGQLLIMLGAGGVFIAAPVMIRHIWDTVPLPDGEMRDRLTAMCRQHRVGVRELLLWRTFGGIVNAAVMGLFAPVRYILLTDALLDAVPTRQVEAVMAHELAHVKRRHLFWLMLLAAAAAAALQELWFHIAQPLSRLDWLAEVDDDYWLTGISIASLLSWLAVFGWISRRFERQADTFAVQHLAHQRDAQDAQPRIDAESVQTMVQALQDVADLNHIPPLRRSWRHGSIASRQDYLRTLVDKPTDDLPIDRQVTLIKWLGAAIVVVMIAMAAIG